MWSGEPGQSRQRFSPRTQISRLGPVKPKYRSERRKRLL